MTNNNWKEKWIYQDWAIDPEFTSKGKIKSAVKGLLIAQHKLTFDRLTKKYEHQRQKDKERLLEGIEKLDSNYGLGEEEIYKTALEDVKQLIKEIYGE